MPVGKSLKISEDEKLTKEFRVNLVEYSFYQGETRINGLIEWNEDMTTLAFVLMKCFTHYHTAYLLRLVLMKRMG